MKYFKISCILFSMLVISNTANAQWSMEPCWLEICGTDKCLEYDIDNNNIHNNSVYYNIKYYNKNAKDYIVATIQSKGTSAGIVSSSTLKLFELNNGYDFDQNPYEAGIASKFQPIKPYTALYKINMLAMEDTALEYKEDIVSSNEDFSNSTLYYDRLQKRIKKYWKTYTNRKNYNVRHLSATVQFLLNKKGEVVFNTIYKSSGMEEYDKNVLKIIRDLSPFEPLPEDFKGNNITIKYTFDYNTNVITTRNY